MRVLHACCEVRRDELRVLYVCMLSWDAVPALLGRTDPDVRPPVKAAARGAVCVHGVCGAACLEERAPCLPIPGRPPLYAICSCVWGTRRRARGPAGVSRSKTSLHSLEYHGLSHSAVLFA